MHWYRRLFLKIVTLLRDHFRMTRLCLEFLTVTVDMRPNTHSLRRSHLGYTSHRHPSYVTSLYFLNISHLTWVVALSFENGKSLPLVNLPKATAGAESYKYARYPPHKPHVVLSLRNLHKCWEISNVTIHPRNYLSHQGFRQ